MPTAAQIALGRQIPLSAGLFFAMSTDTPLLGGLDARTSRSTKFMSLRCVLLPTAGPFVNYGEGFAPSEAELAITEFDCSLVGGQIKAELITARKWDTEHPDIGFSWMDLQTETKIKSQALALEKQVVYGTAYDAKGFPGLKELTPYISANVLAATAYANAYQFKRSVINAGGTTANTASSVYAIIEGPKDVQLVLGDDMGGANEIFRFEDAVRSNEAPDSNQPTKKLLHDVVQFSGHLGLSVSDMNQTPNSVVPVQYCLRRIANLTGDSGKGLTDALMSKLERSFGPGKRPSKFAMSSRSGEQLAASRQAAQINILMGGGDASLATFNTYPPPPENWKGIPIIYPDNTILDTDAIEA